MRRLSIATDGGGLSPADQAALAARVPAIAAAVRRRSPLAAARVGAAIGDHGRRVDAMLDLCGSWPR